MERLLEFRKPRTGELLSFKTRQYYVTEDGQVYDGNLKRYLKQYENGKENTHKGYRWQYLEDYQKEQKEEEASLEKLASE